MLELDQIEPPLLLLALQLGRRSFDEREIRLAVAVAELVVLAARVQLLDGEVTDRDEHPEPRLPGDVALPEQALIDEIAKTVEHLAPDVAGRAADGLELLAPRAAHEHRGACEQPLQPIGEEVVAPR